MYWWKHFFPDHSSHLISNFHILQIAQERSLKKTSIALSRTKLVRSGFDPEISSSSVHTTRRWAYEEVKCCQTMTPSSTVQQQIVLILPLTQSQPSTDRCVHLILIQCFRYVSSYVMKTSPMFLFILMLLTIYGDVNCIIQATSWNNCGWLLNNGLFSIK